MRPLTHELVDFLFTDSAGAALAELSGQDLSDDQILPALVRLREHFTPAQAAALIDQARLRRAAVEKFPDANRLFFTEESLQQATSREVACYRARHCFAGYTRVADLGCGIGADTLALAEVVPSVVAVEQDPIRARLVAANVAARGLADRVDVVCADWTELPLDVEAAFVDPARRIDGRRIFRADQLVPPISAVHALREYVSAVVVKVMPGIADAQIPADAEVEFISERGTCKEALLRFGDLHRGVARTATLLPGPCQLDSTMPAAPVPVCEPANYLYEPDAAVIRATLVEQLGVLIGAAQIDPHIAYLTNNAYVETPFARVWHVLRHGPFHLKTLNRWLRELDAGVVTIKTRGSPIDPDSFRRRLKTVKSGRPLTAFLTRVEDQPWMIVGEET